MKVLQINTVSNSRSTGKIVEGIGAKITEKGWESFVGSGRRFSSVSASSQQIFIGNELDYKIHAIGTRISDRHGFFSKNATTTFLNKVEKIKPDLIHLHNIHGYYLNIDLLFQYIKSHGIPVIWTFHDCWAYTGHCAYYTARNCTKWQTACNSCPQTHSYPKSFIDQSEKNFLDKKKIFSNVKNMTIVTPSKWLADEVGNSFLGKYPVSVINNGINLSVFAPRPFQSLREKLNLNREKIVLGVASVWEERKGLKDFIKLASLINDNFKIILVGVSAKQKRDLPHNIVGIERTESIDELAQYYSLADFFFNPTYEDNFPTTNIEALACGTPVITYRTGGSPEAIDEKTGVIVEQGSVDEVFQIVSSREKADFSKQCRQHAVHNFDQDVVFQKYVQLYQNVLEQ